MMDSIVFGEDSDEKSYMEDESDDLGTKIRIARADFGTRKVIY